MNFDISYSIGFSSKKCSVVLNCGEPVLIPDGSVLGNFQSGLYNDITLSGDRLIVIEIGDNHEVSNEIADQCRSEWTPVFLHHQSCLQLADLSLLL